MNMEQDGYSFEEMMLMIKKEFEELFEEPYNFNPLQAASFLDDQHDILRLRYNGFSETLHIILVDLLTRYTAYSPKKYAKALDIIETNVLPRIWEEYNVAEEFRIKRAEFLNDLRTRIIEIQK
ncbi:hypothetical protein [Bacillus weihaiensis]|uniref:hypothetical protein n=1 Tax=Bacillus weihaiensis TaxID=1547283 RepID=UPI002355D72B|nr:hypothetical protein [Bacillus weihaiensis]